MEAGVIHGVATRHIVGVLLCQALHRAQFDLSLADTGVATASNMPQHKIHDVLIC
jgi:hypothetical protein